MSVGGPDLRYFKDGAGRYPNWRFALKWPRHYVWNRVVRTLPWKYARHFRWLVGAP
jgi:hypothetical protein